MATKFIRVRGRIVPVKDKSATAKDPKKRYPKVNTAMPGVIAAGAALGAATGAAASRGSSMVKRAAFTLAGALLGGGIGSDVSYTKRAKGESERHLKARVAKATSGGSSV